MWIFILITAATAWLIKRSVSKPKNYPPGPVRLPLVGSTINFIRSDPKFPYKAISKLADKYGPVVGMWFGMQPTILVDGPEAVKEAFYSDDLSGRPINVTFRERGGEETEPLGIFNTDGPIWQEQRRFCLRQLRDFGFGRVTGESIALDEVAELIPLIKELAKSNNGIVNIQSQLTVSLINVLWTIVAGKKYKHNDEKFLEVLDMTNRMFRSGAKIFRFITPLPFLRHIAPEATGWTEFVTTLRAIRQYMIAAINEHKSNSIDQPKDFIDAYLNELEKQKEAGTSEANGFSEDQLAVCIMDFFGAGTESTANTITFLILHLLHNPDVQEKLHNHIDQTIGKNRLPSLADRVNLPYVDAVLNEVMRVSNIAMLAVPHRAMRDTTLQGYFIPENAMIMINLWSLHMDRAYWGDPENFRPERHLTDDGKLKKSEFHLLPFGAGRRSCAGESLARANLFLIVTALLQAFKFSVPQGHPLPSLEPDVGFTDSAKPFEVHITSR